MNIKKIWHHGSYELFQLETAEKILLILLFEKNVIKTSFEWESMIAFIDKKIKPD